MICRDVAQSVGTERSGKCKAQSRPLRAWIFRSTGCGLRRIKRLRPARFPTATNSHPEDPSALMAFSMRIARSLDGITGGVRDNRYARECSEISGMAAKTEPSNESLSGQRYGDGSLLKAPSSFETGWLGLLLSSGSALEKKQIQEAKT